MSKRDKLISVLKKKTKPACIYIDSFIESPLNDHNYIIMFKKNKLFYLLKPEKNSFLWEAVLRIYIIPIPIEYYISLSMKITVIDILVLLNQLLVIKEIFSLEKYFK